MRKTLRREKEKTMSHSCRVNSLTELLRRSEVVQNVSWNPQLLNSDLLCALTDICNIASPPRSHPSMFSLPLPSRTVPTPSSSFIPGVKGPRRKC